ncbi:MAG TPA: MBL fold metallo-hydrolase, partial [Terriglobales bacterium]|nr:MBL fold metallo-hydrolase [Terriglobales bacterium]
MSPFLLPRLILRRPRPFVTFPWAFAPTARTFQPEARHSAMMKRMRNICLLFVSLLAFAHISAATSFATNERTVTKLADGVYVIIHKDAIHASWPQGNTTIVIGDRDVFVVDACFLPGSAREDIAEIKRLTNKPVRYLLNTHFHIDHNAGNSAYIEAFPDLEV